MRPGLVFTLIALAFAGITAVTITLTTSEFTTTVAQMAALGVGIFAFALLFGGRQVAAAATLPVLGSALIEVALSDDPSWVRAIIIGCLWYVTLELGWDAIDRRDGTIRSRQAELRRLQELLTVLMFTVGIGALALIGESLAPLRTLPVQAVVLIGFLVAFVSVVRHLISTGARP